jgi:hypothetical protein
MTHPPITLGKHRDTPKKRKLTLQHSNAIYPNGRSTSSRYRVGLSHKKRMDLARNTARVLHARGMTWREMSNTERAALVEGLRDGAQTPKQEVHPVTANNRFFNNLYAQDPNIVKFLVAMNMNTIRNQEALDWVNKTIKNLNR